MLNRFAATLRDMNYLHSPIPDGGIPTIEQMDILIQYIDDLNRKGSAVGIHCAAGALFYSAAYTISFLFSDFVQLLGNVVCELLSCWCTLSAFRCHTVTRSVTSVSAILLCDCISFPDLYDIYIFTHIYIYMHIDIYVCYSTCHAPA